MPLNSTAEHYAYLYENLCKYFLIWYLPFTIVLGTLGSLFSLFFLFCSKLFQSGMLLWLSSICLGDFFILMLEGVWMLLKVWFRYDIRDENDVICVIHKTASNYFLYWSAYMQCALSVQRAYLVFQPLRARSQQILSRRHALTWIIITVVLLIPMAPYPIFWRVIQSDCDPLRRDIFYVTTLCDLIIWGIIPLLGMTISTFVICLNMAKVDNSFAKKPRVRKVGAVKINEVEPKRVDSPSLQTHSTMEQNSLPIAEQIQSWTNNSTIETNITVLTAPAAVLKKQECKLPKEHSSCRHNAPDNWGHVTRLLICMNIAYMSSTFPLLIFLMFRNFSDIDVHPDVHRFIYYMFRSLCFLNSCTNWIFYCLVGKLFREEAKEILRMCFGFPRRVSYRERAQSLSANGKLGNNSGLLVNRGNLSHQVSPSRRKAKSVCEENMQCIVSSIPIQ